MAGQRLLDSEAPVAGEGADLARAICTARLIWNEVADAGGDDPLLEELVAAAIVDEDLAANVIGALARIVLHLAHAVALTRPLSAQQVLAILFTGFVEKEVTL
jgi:hypothetical protein